MPVHNNVPFKPNSTGTPTTGWAGSLAVVNWADSDTTVTDGGRSAGLATNVVGVLACDPVSGRCRRRHRRCCRVCTLSAQVCVATVVPLAPVLGTLNV